MRLPTAAAVAVFTLAGCSAPLLPADDAAAPQSGDTISIESTGLPPETSAPEIDQVNQPTTSTSTTTTTTVSSSTQSTTPANRDNVSLDCGNGRSVHRAGGFVIARAQDGEQLASVPDQGNRLQLMIEEWCYIPPLTSTPTTLVMVP